MLNNPYSGANLLAEWQATPWPWLTQSSVPAGLLVGYEFQQAAKSLRIQNHDAANPMRIGFTQGGVNGTNYFLVPASGSLQLDVKFSQVWIRGTSGQVFSLFVGLTGIPVRNFGPMSGSGLNIGG